MLNNKKAMTLMELLAVIVILGIIAAIAVPSVGGIIENSRKRATLSNATTAVEAARSYATDNDQDLGGNDDFSGGINISVQTLIDQGYLSNDFANSDPWANDTDGGYDLQYLSADGTTADADTPVFPASPSETPSYVNISRNGNAGSYTILVYLNGNGYDVQTASADDAVSLDNADIDTNVVDDSAT